MSRLLEWEPSPPWMRDAACRGMDPELFFPERGASPADYEEARAVCATCPVRQECAEYAVPEKHGIWGGLSERERRRVRSGGPAAVPLGPIRTHGTESGYRAHKRRGESACALCQVAHNATTVAERAARRARREAS